MLYHIPRLPFPAPFRSLGIWLTARPGPGKRRQRRLRPEPPLPWWQSCGVILRTIRGRLQGAFVEVLYYPQRDRREGAKSRNLVIAAIKELINDIVYQG